MRVGVVEEFGVVPVGVGVAAECVVAGGVVACAAGRLVRVFFRRALGATVDVEPEDRLARVDGFLREVECVEGVRVGGVVKLVEDGGDFVVGGVFFGGQGE